jgi:hypothetical protein
MDRIEIQRALYTSRNEYLKSAAITRHHAREIQRLKELERGLDRPSLMAEMFGMLG